ncbi:Transcriptional antiterminator [Evansella caseinilytica]|uniref:Transcriptional antiterminator n=1 Tax=Evansella caseinilytica TaxID=1503961 RepID=A0A1H3HI41_9BACI|nr:HTH domain-containing protein [Evansella caseinilytica]SDY14895.1 Transcriptional antiterminator [Evansella caseinilytica]
MLTERELKIAVNLVESRTPIKIKDLSQQFDVSTRTIKYDLDHVKSWFREHGIKVHSQPNKGIWVDCDDRQRHGILKEILGNERRNQNPGQSFRLKKILMTMLLHNGYITAAELAESLQVSRNTILNDMNLAGEFVTPWLIRLERARRIGYKLTGEELHLRLLLEHFIYSDLTNYEIYQIMTRISTREGSSVKELEPLMDTALLSVYKIAEMHLSNLYEPAISQLFHQSDLITLLIRITVSVTRLNMGQALKSYRVLNKNHYQDSVSMFILSFMEKVFTELKLPLLENEFLYLLGEIDKGMKGVDLFQATTGIIEEVSEREGIDYRRDSQLFSSLYAHLSLRLQRGIVNMAENNPFAEEIKHDHPLLFTSVSDACRAHLGMSVMVNQDAFISLIALHFLTSFENSFSKTNKVRALYVCSTGRGVARLIKNRVEKEIHDIDVVAYCSIMEVEELCKQEKIDLIISVFPIQADKPVIVVDAVPVRRDIEAIREKVADLMNRQPSHSTKELLAGKNTVTEDAETISQEIILKGFEVLQEIVSVFSNDIEASRLQALQLHIFLMVHRCYFDQQYDEFLYTNHQISKKNRQDLQTIRNILEQMELSVQESELIALLQYLK